MIFDQQQSRIGLTKKRNQYCRTNLMNSEEKILRVNDNDILRLVFNAGYVILLLYLILKTSKGCFQFYDITLASLLGYFRKDQGEDVDQ